MFRGERVVVVFVVVSWARETMRSERSGPVKRMRGDKGTEGGHGKRMREEGKGITTHHVICTFLRCVLLCNVLKNTGLFCRGSCPLPFFCTGDVNVVVQRFIKVPPNVCARVWRGPPFFSFSSLVCLVLLLLHPVLSSVPCCASRVASPERASPAPPRFLHHAHRFYLASPSHSGLRAYAQ